MDNENFPERIATLTAENERLRGYSDALKGQRDRAEARNRELAVQLEGTKQVRLRTEELVREVDEARARNRALVEALKSARYRFMLMRVAEVLPGEEATFCRYVQAEAKHGTESADAALTEPTPPQGPAGGIPTVYPTGWVSNGTNLGPTEGPPQGELARSVDEVRQKLGL